MMISYERLCEALEQYRLREQGAADPAPSASARPVPPPLEMPTEPPAAGLMADASPAVAAEETEVQITDIDIAEVVEEESAVDSERAD